MQDRVAEILIDEDDAFLISATSTWPTKHTHGMRFPSAFRHGEIARDLVIPRQIPDEARQAACGRGYSEFSMSKMTTHLGL